MKQRSMLQGIIFIISILLLTHIGFSSFQKQSIRVIVDNASIRLKPDLQSEIIKTPPLGSVFEVENKEGDWYEIRFKTELGVVLPGFIHGMYVESVGTEETPPLPEKKSPEPKKKTVQALPPTPPRTSTTGPKTAEKRFDVALRAGYMMGYDMTETASYTKNFSGGNVQSATANGRIILGLKNPLSFDGELNFFFLKGLGAQLRFDYNGSANLTDNSRSEYDLNWTWITDVSDSESADWAADGEVSLIVLSGNLVYKIGSSSSLLSAVLSGGVSYFSGNAAVNTTIAYSTTWWTDGFRYIDYFNLPAEVDVSLSGIGFNFGGGVDLNLTPTIAVNLDARYFLTKDVEEPWAMQPGVYPSNISSGWTVTLDQDAIDKLQSEITPFSINPSFIKIAGGIKIRF